jgi:hypothetical protein
MNTIVHTSLIAPQQKPLFKQRVIQKSFQRYFYTFYYRITGDGMTKEKEKVTSKVMTVCTLLYERLFLFFGSAESF